MSAVVAARLVGLTAEIKKLGEVSQKGAAALNSLIAPLDYVQSVTAALARNFNEFLLPPLRSATNQVRSLSAATATYGEEISRAARLSHLGAERYQGLRYAAEQAGVAHEHLTQGLAGLHRSAVSALAGNEALLGSFASLGISAEELKSLDPDQLFLRLVDALGTIGDPAKSAEIATALFGETGAALARLAETGSAGIEAMAQRARDFGLVLTPEQIAGAASFRNGLDQLNAALNGLALTVGSQLLPALQPVVDKLTLWIAANKELVSAKVEEIVSKVATAIIQMDFDKLFADITGVVDAIASLIDALGGWEVAAVALIGLLSGDKALSFAAVMGGGIAALWNKVKGEPTSLESAKEAVAEGMDELRDNREKYKTASLSERKLLDQQFDQTLLSTQEALDVVANEIEKMPKRKPVGPRGIVKIDNPERAEEEQIARVTAAQLGMYRAQRNKEDTPMQPSPDPGTSTRQSDASSFSKSGTAQLKGALDVYVHVEGTPTKVSVVERPGGNLSINPELGYNSRFLHTGY
jgi:hypothetical protein